MTDSNQQLAVREAPMFSLSTLDEAVNFAGQMAKANLLPSHLKGSPADCLRVVMQAARWQMDPFSVADKTSVISGKLMYEGQLVSAVVNARGNLAKRLDYKFDGEGEKRVLTVTGTLRGESEAREITLDVPMARRINKNGQMNQNPDQQMCYIGARMWARRHTSELMLGVYTPDEIDPDAPEGEPRNVTGSVTEGQQPAPVVRADPKPRKGAAAAKEAAKEVVVEQEPAKTEPAPVQAATEPKNVTPVAEPAKAVEPAPIPKPVEQPAANAPRAFLKDDEHVTVACEVVSLEAVEAPGPNGTKIPSVKAVVKGEYNGKVQHLGGGMVKDGKVVPAAPYAVGANVILKLHGRKSTATSGPLVGTVIAWVESVEAAAAEF
jgi:hypothetical protein